MFDEVSKISKIRDDKEKFELPRNLARENYKHFDLPRNHFSDVKSEVKEDSFELSRKIVNDVEKNIAKTLEEKIIEGKPLQFKDIKNYLVYPSLKETIASTAYASSVLMALKKTNPELVKVDAKSLEKDLNKFYSSNLNDISRNSDNSTTIEKSKSKEFATKALELATSLIYISGKLILDTGVAIENGLNVGLDSTAKFFEQPILETLNFDLFSNLSSEFSEKFNHPEQLDNFILALEEIPKTIAELYLTVQASVVYLETKIVLGAGHIVEGAAKFILEGGAMLIGQDEFARKVQQSHVVDDISKVVDESLEGAIQSIDKISKTTNVSKSIDGLHVAGNIGETVGEFGTKLIITFLAMSTGNIALAASIIALDACYVGGKAVDDAVEKTGNFTNKEMLKGLFAATFDVAEYILGRKIYSFAKNVIPKSNNNFVNRGLERVTEGIGETVSEIPSNIIDPIIDVKFGIDKNETINWKQIGINTGIAFVAGALLGDISDNINVGKLKKIEKIKKEYSVIVDQLKKGDAFENTNLRKLVGKKTFDIIKKGDDKLLDTFIKHPEETAEAIKLYGKKYTEILSKLTRVKERSIYTRLMADKNGDKLLRFLDSLDSKDQISMLKKFAYDGFEKSYLLLDSVPFRKIYRKPKLFDGNNKIIKSKIAESIKNNGADVVDLYGITLNNILSDFPLDKQPLIFDEFIKHPEKISELYNKYSDYVINIKTDVSGYFSTYIDRLNKTPAWCGNWTGIRGESTFIHNSDEIKQRLKEYGLNGIEYRNADVDFSKVAADSVKIDDMTQYRYPGERPDGKAGNFEQAYEKFAEKWNNEAKDGKIDWTARDVQEWIKNPDLHGGQTLVVHERTDKMTCDLVPADIHKVFTHLGGCAECKRRDINIDIGGFDE